MLTRIGQVLARQNRRLLSAVLTSRSTMAFRCVASVPPNGAAPSPKARLANVDIQDASVAAEMNLEDAVAASYTGVIVQGFQGEPVEGFSAMWARGVMDHAVSTGRETLQERLDNRQQGVQGDIEPSSAPSTDQTKTTVSTDSHRRQSNVSLYSVMQSQVPKPYGRDPPHVNMPGGGLMSQARYIAGQLNDVHPSRKLSVCAWHRARHAAILSGNGLVSTGRTNIAHLLTSCLMLSSRAAVGGGSPNSGGHHEEKKLSQKDKLKRAVKEYGATVVVFHVCISLLSLGGFYVAVSSGIDVVSILQSLGVGESLLSSRIATGASTFVIAYAVHKVFAPVRIAITLTSTPFIVRYLRLRGILKAPKV